MRLRLAAKLYALITAVLVLGTATAVVGTVVAWHVGNLLQYAVTNNMPSLVAAEELEIALLLESRAIRSLVMEPGKQIWLDELGMSGGEFDKWWAEAQRTPNTPTEVDILNRLREAHRRYAGKRDEIVDAVRAGNADRSRAALDELNHLFRQCYDLCEEYLAINQKFATDAVVAAQDQIKGLTWLVTICDVLSIGAGLLLLWLVFRGILLPLRRMAAEARVVADIDAPVEAEHDDEPRIVGRYLRLLMSDVLYARSSLQQHQEKLAETERKLASVGKLAASVAHEIRNPLGAIKMCLQMIRKTVNANAEAERILGMAEEEITRLDGIVKSFLEFSRPPKLNLQPENLSMLLDKTIRLVEPVIQQKHIRLQCDALQHLPDVMADSDQLRQVIINLLKNAAEATPEDGEIHIRGTATEESGRPMVVLHIHNTGPAIPEEVRERLFEPFFTTKTGGTGLGLAIAARIMAQHGGRLLLESTPEPRTTFAVSIPAAIGPRQSASCLEAASASEN